MSNSLRCDLSCPADCSGPCKYHPVEPETNQPDVWTYPKGYGPGDPQHVIDAALKRESNGEDVRAGYDMGFQAGVASAQKEVDQLRAIDAEILQHVIERGKLWAKRQRILNSIELCDDLSCYQAELKEWLGEMSNDSKVGRE